MIIIAVIALPWLSVKYVPVAAVLALAGLWRIWGRDRRSVLGPLAVYAVAGIGYLVLHRWLYGGWTVYAAGDHFVDGEFQVIGSNPDYLARSRRLIGLLVDRRFGLVAWNPAFIVLPAALVWLAKSKRPGRFAILAIFAAGWGTATWIALTMHGWWWPGRQVVPVLPLAVAAVAAFVGRSRRVLVGVLVATLLGAISWLIVLWEASTDRRTLIVDFDQTVNPWYRLWRLILPDHQRWEPVDIALTAAWFAILVVGCFMAARRSEPGESVTSR